MVAWARPWWRLWPNLVALSVDVQVMNALLLPLVLGFLIALAVWALPPALRLRGWYLWVVAVVAGLTTALGRVRRHPGRDRGLARSVAGAGVQPGGLSCAFRGVAKLRCR